MESAQITAQGLAARTGYFSVDFVKSTWEVSSVCRDILGVDAAYPLAMTDWRQLVYPEDQEAVSAVLAKSQRSANSLYCICRIIRPQDKRICWVMVSGDFLLDAQNHVIKLLGAVQDQTVERVVQQGCVRLNLGMDQVGNAIYLINAEGRCVYLNDEAMRIQGWARQEWMQHFLWDIDALCSSSALWLEWLERLQATPQVTFESLHRDKNGVSFPVRIHALFYECEGESYVLGLAQDIREKKALEGEIEHYRHHIEENVQQKTLELARLNARLHRSAQLQRVLSQSSQLLLQINREEVFRQKLCQLLVDLSAVGMAWIAFELADRKQTMQRVGQAVARPEFVQVLDTYTWWATPADLWSRLYQDYLPQVIEIDHYRAGSVWLEQLYQMDLRCLLLLPFKLEDGQSGVLALTTTQEDFFENEGLMVLQELVQDFVRGISVLRLRQYHATAVNELAIRVRNESLVRQQMQDLANKLQLIFDSMNQAIMVWDREQRLLMWNRWVHSIFPKSAAQIYRTMNRQDLVNLLEREDEVFCMAREWEQWVSPVRENVHAADGRILDVTRLIAEDGSHIMLLEDITEITSMRDTLAHNDRLASLGSMVAGIAHELNTPIGVALTAGSSIRADSVQIQQQIASGQVRKSVLLQLLDNVITGTQLVESNLRRANQLISSFKQVAVDQTLAQRRVFELRPLVQEVMFALQPLLKPNKITWTLEQHQEIVMDSFPGPLGQIITNLVNNAVNHAFHKPGGRIHMRVILRDDDFIELLFSDNGEGIRPDHLKRVFDPFFTTKMGQGGTGLGLHIVHNNVTRVLQGQIGVRSEIGAGTQFVMLIPRGVKGRTEDAGTVAEET